MKKYIEVIGLGLLLGAFILLPKVFNEKKLEEKPIEKIEMPSLIEVEIKGAIHMPGLYYVSADTTYRMLFDYALGIQNNADITMFDLNEKINSSKVIDIPFIGDIVTPSIKININQATKEQLMTLPSVGEVTAEKIIQYRTLNGAFIRLEDLKLVSGIGEATFEKFKHLITL